MKTMTNAEGVILGLQFFECLLFFHRMALAVDVAFPHFGLPDLSTIDRVRIGRAYNSSTVGRPAAHQFVTNVAPNSIVFSVGRMK